jgi:hypothetical protein
MEDIQEKAPTRKKLEIRTTHGSDTGSKRRKGTLVAESKRID